MPKISVRDLLNFYRAAGKRKTPSGSGTRKTDMGQVQVQHHSIIWMSDMGYRCLGPSPRLAGP